MSTRTISQVLVDGLVANAVSQVFGVVGDALNSVTEAIRVTDGIDWIGVRHEEVAAYAAGAQSQLTGTLGVCGGTVGPGSIHLLNGLYDAAKSHTPGARDHRSGAARRDRQQLLPGGRQRPPVP